MVSLIIPMFFSLALFFFIKEDLRKHRESIRYSSVRSSMISDLSQDEED